jgi:ComF family protein
MRHPAGKPDYVQGGTNTTIGIGRGLLIGRGYLGEEMARGKAAGAIGERIGGAQRLQFGHQSKGIGIADAVGFDIGHRQGEAGALQQRPGVAHLRHGSDTRRSAAGNDEVGSQKGFTQFGKAVSADHGDKQQAIGAQPGAQPGHVAGHVIDGMQMQQGDDQVEFAVGQGGKVVLACKSFDLPERDHARGGRHLARQQIDIGGNEDRIGKIAHMGAEAVGKIVKDQVAHEIVAARAPLEIADQLGEVEQAGRLGHAVTSQKNWPTERPWSTMALMESGAREVKGRGLSARVWQGGRWLAMALLDQIYPPCCAACGDPIADGAGLCAGCFAKLVPITAPFCQVLGVPFEVSLGPDAVSAEALADPPPFSRARAAARYGEVAQALVTRLKYGDRTELAAFCARLMASAGHEFWADKPLLVPVPLHPSRLRFRRYNQSFLLAQALGGQLGLDVDPFLVTRHRKTRSQVGLSGDGRARNVQGAFSTHVDMVARLRGRRVVLVDDVYTTGATVKAVVRTLLRNGASEVDVLTFARVVSGEEVPI